MNSYVEKLAAPVKELNALAVKNIEQLTELQLKTIQDNATIGVESIKNASAITDLEGLQSFLTDQAEVAKQIVEGILANARTVAELSQGYAAEAKEIAETSLKAVK
ncbi:MAG: TIGR01841 family phasin [Proteobacteria bacterium]|nr:TIGR01841 family phasin [Pseudomonadota bacterium]